MKYCRTGDSVPEAAVRGVAGSIRGVNPLRSATNCVNCAIATDATLAGRADVRELLSVKMQPRSAEVDLDKWSSQASVGTRLCALRTEFERLRAHAA